MTRGRGETGPPAGTPWSPPKPMLGRIRSSVLSWEMNEMNEVVMEEVDNMQLGGMMGGKQSLVGTEKKRSEL